MLEGELDVYLVYDKHRSNVSDNARNGYGTKKIKTKHGKAEIRFLVIKTPHLSQW
jgi:putative transposase